MSNRLCIGGFLCVGLLGLAFASCQGIAGPTDAPATSKGGDADVQAAVKAILEYGGFVKYDEDGRVCKVSLVYTEDEWGNRIECRGTSDEILSQLPKLPDVRELLLMSSQATDRGMAYVGQLMKLEKLFMWDAAQISDAGTAHLANLRNLKHIHISNSLIGDGTLETMSRLKELTSIGFQNNRFTDDGFKWLEHMPQLTDLWVGSAGRVSDAAMPHFAKLTNLKILELQSSVVTDAGIMQLKDIKSLKGLILCGGSVTKEGARELEAAIPGLKVAL